MSILELVDNIFQLVVTFGVFLTACVLAIKNPKFVPFQYLAGASICWFTGTLYWTIYFIIYKSFVYYFSASELCYMALYLFLIGVCVIFLKENHRGTLLLKHKLLSTIFPCFVLIINSVSYIMHGGLFWNLYYAVPLMILAFVSSENLFVIKSKALYKFNLCIVGLVFANNLMFLMSCFGFNILYVIFDFICTMTLPIMLFYIKQEAEV